MIKQVTKTLGFVLFLLFINGIIILPALHQAHCRDNDTTHEASKCSICQLASLPLVTALSALSPDFIFVALDFDISQMYTVFSSSLHDATQARAPPVC